MPLTEEQKAARRLYYSQNKERLQEQRRNYLNQPGKRDAYLYYLKEYHLIHAPTEEERLVRNAYYRFKYQEKIEDNRRRAREREARKRRAAGIPPRLFQTGPRAIIATAPAPAPAPAPALPSATVQGQDTEGFQVRWD